MILRLFFCRYRKVFFADSKAEITFVDGMLTGYKQTTESEAFAAIKLPAEIASSYFAEIGEVFTNFKKNDELNMNSMDARIKLELAKQKYESCIAAISTKNENLIKTLGCGG